MKKEKYIFNMKNHNHNINERGSLGDRFLRSAVAIFIFVIIFSTIAVPTGNAATSPSQVDFSSPTFKFSVCDGPKLPTQDLTDKAQVGLGHPYVVCDFNAAILQVQLLINVMIALGVFVAIISFTYAGFLYIQGKPEDRTKASGMFPKIGLGFIIMLSAWFIVYQLLSWLAKNPALTKLLGSP